jgi:hypothetical protein
VEIFCDDPDIVIARALEARARGSMDDVKDREAPWESSDKVDLSIHSGTFGW